MVFLVEVARSSTRALIHPHPLCRYDTADFRGNDGQGEDNGLTLAVFTGEGTVCLKKTNSGRQFGPSVLAPFARVVIDHQVRLLFAQGF